MDYPTRCGMLDKFKELTGYTPKAVDSKLCRGVWTLGREVILIGGRRHADLQMYEKWVQRGK